MPLSNKKNLRDCIIAARKLEASIYDSPDDLPDVSAFQKIAESISCGRGFPTQRARDVGGGEVNDFVEGLLTEGGASVIYGPSNCGKSFWILDLAVCVATGTNFRDELEVDQGAVVYVALEGTFGVRNRIEALKREGKLTNDAPLYLCFSPASLLEREHAGKLAEAAKKAAKESGLPCRLIVVDTLARAMAGGDENGATDMTLAVASVDAIRAATGAHVALVHHCGKDEARGARGHSSLKAAMDTEIELFRPEGSNITTARPTKQRDMSIGPPMPFSLKQVDLGTDRRGRSITSCVVKHEDEIMADGPKSAGRKRGSQSADMLSLLPKVSTVEWAKAAKEEFGVASSTFYRLRSELEKSGQAKKRQEGGWER